MSELQAMTREDFEAAMTRNVKENKKRVYVAISNGTTVLDVYSEDEYRIARKAVQEFRAIQYKLGLDKNGVICYDGDGVRESQAS